MWWSAVGAGAFASLPVGWLLSYGAALPFMLGLFFFALFGLVLGAVVYRVGHAARPVAKSSLLAGVAVVVFVCWATSLIVEARDFPSDKAHEALIKIAPMPEGMSSREALTDVQEFVRKTLREQYGGSGVFGYARWVIASSYMPYHVDTMKNPIVLRPCQHRGWWVARVALSVVLLSFGVYSQAAALMRTVESTTPEADP